MIRTQYQIDPTHPVGWLPNMDAWLWPYERSREYPMALVFHITRSQAKEFLQHFPPPVGYAEGGAISSRGRVQLVE